MSTTLNTEAVAPSHRLAFWTDVVCQTYVQLQCDAPAGCDAIDGEIVCDELATLQLSRVTATAQFVRRTPDLIARANEDHFLVSIQTRGRGVVSQDGRDAVLAPGDFALYDSTRPYQLTFDDDFQQFVLKLPGPTLRSALRDTQQLTATRVGGDRGAGHLMIQMIRTLAEDVGSLAPESAVAVADSVSQILLAGLATLPAAKAPPVSHLTAYHREQIKALVRARLGDPELDVAQIARALRLSPSSVHRAWSGEPCSLSHWIWSQRLHAAHRDLCDPSMAARGVSAIAFAWGFSDAAHFSRAFRARFGCSPRDIRPL
ncbi:helix-turn-helix domain-containing protein [Piscinibacter sp.]|uniref:AraC-like ligand-binding domain-containing protein n=1 Tax=Piscinibacter sp. TaxID=1903157 RepID=UPI002B8D60D2|nr:helix-turn-helix domain-containing protein [Albitalea sp.]HUG24413.1 helix-turn-helix domain-containing protein [Albitalea sp.]